MFSFEFWRRAWWDPKPLAWKLFIIHIWGMIQWPNVKYKSLSKWTPDCRWTGWIAAPNITHLRWNRYGVVDACCWKCSAVSRCAVRSPSHAIAGPHAIEAHQWWAAMRLNAKQEQCIRVACVYVSVRLVAKSIRTTIAIYAANIGQKRKQNEKIT